MILNMYVTAFPVILSGILNMAFTRTGFYQRHRMPIDRGQCLRDGRRILGDNKTWVGFFAMIALCAVIQPVFGLFLQQTGLETHNELYRIHTNRFVYNVWIGFLFGLAYMLLELPNSFVKRRLGIEPGKTHRSGIGAVFFVIDQIDSLIGVMAVIYVFSDISFQKYLGYIALGGITHIGINLVLFKIRIRRNL